MTWDNLAEVKALAVEEKFQGQGIGKRLLEAVTKVAKDLDIRRVFTLTIRTGFFEHFGFNHVSKDHLPHKVWTECVKCIYFPERCVEYAMVKDLPGPDPRRRRSPSEKKSRRRGICLPERLFRLSLSFHGVTIARKNKSTKFKKSRIIRPGGE